MVGKRKIKGSGKSTRDKNSWQEPPNFLLPNRVIWKNIVLKYRKYRLIGLFGILIVVVTVQQKQISRRLTFRNRSIRYTLAVPEESRTGDADMESGAPKQPGRPPHASPFDVASPTQSPPTGSLKRKQTWQRELGIRVPQSIDKWNEERRKYWTYQNVYHIPVPEGIEFWEDDDKDRWEMVHIGGMDESEADQRIKSKVCFLRLFPGHFRTFNACGKHSPCIYCKYIAQYCCRLQHQPQTTGLINSFESCTLRK